jgi:hypothetical protein
MDANTTPGPGPERRIVFGTADADGWEPVVEDGRPRVCRTGPDTHYLLGGVQHQSPEHDVRGRAVRGGIVVERRRRAVH